MERDVQVETLGNIEVQNMAMQQGIAAIVGMLEKSTLSAAEEAILQNRLQNLRLSPNSITKNRLIASNSGGKVYVGEYAGSVVAVKEMLNMSKSISENEMIFMDILRHPNIIHVFGYCEESGVINVVMEYASKGNLSQQADQELSRKLYCLLDVITAIEFCHLRSVIHRDIKPDNILVDADMRCKLCDFGLAKRRQGASMHTIVGTAGFMAPEMLSGQGVTAKSDVYSFGMTCLRVMKNNSDTNLTVADRLSLSFEGIGPPLDPLRVLIAACLRREPEDRPTSSQVKALMELIIKSVYATDPRGASQQSLSPTSPVSPFPVIPPSHREIYDFLLTKARLRVEECVPYSKSLYDHKANTVDKLNRKIIKNSIFLSECNITDEDDVESIMIALKVEFPQEEKQAIISPPLPPSIQVDDDNVIDMKQWLKDNAHIDSVHSLTYARMIVSQNNVPSWLRLKYKLTSDPGFLYRDCNIRNEDETSIMQGLGVKSRLECVTEISTALSIELDGKLNEILAKQSSWIESDRELSAIVDVRLQSCLYQVGSICGGDEMMMTESKNELNGMISKSRAKLRQGWEMIVVGEFDSAFNHLLIQMKPVNVKSVDQLGSHLSGRPQAMDGSLRTISNKFGPDDDFVKSKMDSIMNQLMVQYGSIKRGFETLFGVSGQMKQELSEIFNEMERNLATMKWDDIDTRLTSVASNHLNRLTAMRTNLNLSDDLSGELVTPFKLEFDGFMSEKRSVLKRSWVEVLRTRPCRNELDCRMIVVDILKQTRGVLNWNAPDDKGTRFNWSEELPLGEWDGTLPDVTPTQNRIQVDRNGMIVKLFLNKLGMKGILPESIGSLTSVVALSVGNNQLISLPDSIRNLTSSTVLAADANQLTHLPDSIGSMTSLSSLFVFCNQLADLPDSIRNLTSLIQFYVLDNPITSTQAGKDEVNRRFGRDGLKLFV